MENGITLREAVAPADTEAFWTQLYLYFERDIFPDPQDEDRAYFLGPAYREGVERVHDRAQDRCRYLFFCRDGQEIGLAMPVVFTSEDGKCFIMEFCVFPEFRGGGTGRACARALLDWARGEGALYAELNNGGKERRRRFWASVGFADNGADEWGEPLMLLPSQEEVPIRVEMLSDPEDWQLRKLENGFRLEVGEQALEEARQERLSQAIREQKIAFFLAKRGYRAVGMCSVSRCYSTFACGETGVFDDFYVEPVFRGKGIARRLAAAAQAWCRENGMASLTVSCAPGDEAMYRALGFDSRLGTAYAYLTEADASA